MADLTTSIRIAVTDAFTANLKRLGQGLDEVGRKAKQSSEHFRIAADLNQSAEAMGRFGGAVVGALEKPIREFASFDEALAKVSAKTGEKRGSELFEKLKTQAEDLGASTKYSAEQVANAQAEYAASGRNVLEIWSAIPSTLSLATAASISLGQATEITNEVLNQFQLGAEKTAYAQDILARADEISSASVTGLGEALSYVGTTAARLKISLPETAAMLAVLSDAGQKGSMGGTNLSAMLSALVAPTKKQSDALRELGLSAKGVQEIQKQVATGHIDQAIRKMAELNALLSPEKSAKILDHIFEERGGRAASVLFRATLDTGDKGLDSFRAKFAGFDGAVNRTAAIMEDHLGGSLERARGAISGLSTSLGEVMAPTVRSMAGAVEDAADVARKAALEYPEFTRASLGLAAGLGGVALALKGALIATSAYHSMVGMLGKAFEVMSKSMLGKAGLLAASLAVGYAVGAWANEAFKLDDKIASLLGRPAPERLKKGQESDQSRGGVTMRNGEVVDIDKRLLPIEDYGQHLGADGKVTTGYYYRPAAASQVDGIAPTAIVREALASGARTKEEINAYIKRKRAARAGLGGAPADAPVSPYREEGMYAEEKPTWLGPLKQPGSGPATTDDVATREQTAILERAMAGNTDAIKQLVDEIRRGNRRLPAGASTGAGQGAH